MKYLLAIETSCDETAVALADVSSDFKIIDSNLASQIAKHAEYGGVVPEIAAREHLAALPVLIDNLLRKNNLTQKDLDYIAVTRGPGLLGCLLIGLNYAKGLSAALNIPLIGVNHIEGHALSPLIKQKIELPALALIVSGGHTEIQIIEAISKYKLFSRTTDDAAGETFDKAAYLLGLPYPGGAALAKLADQQKTSTFKLPKVMRGRIEFSFSGLKTAISLLIKKNQPIDSKLQSELAKTIQDSIVGELIDKLKLASKTTGIKRVLVSGGVAANKYLRVSLGASGLEAYFADLEHCTDNAEMIAFAAYHALQRQDFLADALSAKASWRLEEASYV